MFGSFKKDDSVYFHQALVIFGIGAGVGIGTCGIGALIQNEQVSPIVLSIGGVLFWVSVLGFLVIGLLSLIRFLLNRLLR